ncbi:MAG: HAD family hydrolase [Candidatus Thorarchaeota archaeon]
MITAVTFDLWNTLITPISYNKIRFNFLIKYFKSHKLDFDFKELKSQFEQFFTLERYNSNVNSNPIIINHIFTEDRIINLLDSLKISLQKKEINLLKTNFEKAVFKNPPKLKLNVKETLKKLAFDYKVGLISDIGITPGHFMRKIMKRNKILQYFDTLIFSDEIGYYKPHPILFETALTNLKVKPHNAIHVGDLLETDIQGAKNSNMLSVWINDLSMPRSVEIQPDYEIRQISEVIDIIQNLS